VSKDNGKVFFQELFGEELGCSVIPQRPRSRTKAMMKQKGKGPIEEHVEKLVKKKTMSKVKESQKMLQWMKMDSNKLKWVKQVNLKGLFNLQWTMP
jgi:hypothetical protein